VDKSVYNKQCISRSDPPYIASREIVYVCPKCYAVKTFPVLSTNAPHPDDYLCDCEMPDRKTQMEYKEVRCPPGFYCPEEEQ